jgi:hypothetical protein
MRNFFTTLAVLAILGAGGLVLWADDAKPTTPPDKPTQVDPKTAAIEHAKLRVKMHRTTADLIEARIAETPDQAKIDQLAKEVKQLRAELFAQRPGPRPDGHCPWGGPGMRRGHGPGPGYGPGPGMGPGYGHGHGHGMGPGPGGPGFGPKPGWGPGFIDQDEDGVCDRLDPPPPPDKNPEK